MEFEAAEPASPNAQCLSSSALSVSILAVIESEVPIDDSQALSLLQDVFLPINSRFSSILVPGAKGEKEWRKCEVKLQDHMYVPACHSGLSTEEYDKYFKDYLSQLAMQDLPRDRPLWQVHLFKYPTSNCAGSVIFKLHHALGDGYSLMGALLSCLKRADNPSFPLTFPEFRSQTKFTANQSILENVHQLFSTAFYTLYDFGLSVLKSSYMSDDPSTLYRSWDAEDNFRPTEISTLSISLDHIKQIKTRLGVTVNDVLAGTVFLGCRLYLQETSPEFTNAKTTAVVFLNTRAFTGYKSVQEMCKRDTDSPWGNHFSVLHVPLPELSEDELSNPLSFVMNAHNLVRRKKISFGTYLFAGFLKLLKKLGGSEATARCTRNALNNSCIGISNLVGPLERMALANQPVKGLYFAFAGAPLCLMITALSYVGQLRITIQAERDLIDCNRYHSCIQKAFIMISEASCQAPPSPH